MYLEQWFLHGSMHHNQLGAGLERQIAGPHSQSFWLSSSGGENPRICISNNFLGDIDIGGLGHILKTTEFL